MRRCLASLAAGATIATLAHGTAQAAELTASQVRVYKHRWQLSAYKVAAYEGRWHWLLRPRFAKCRDIRWEKPRNRCYLHRAGYRWHRERVARIGRILWPPRSSPTTAAPGGLSYWIGRQIWAATIIGQESAGDPWPNCPDPFDGGGTWYATVQCENGGSWLDSPGYFRCGLQFDPMWERRFGRLCP